MRQINRDEDNAWVYYVGCIQAKRREKFDSSQTKALETSQEEIPSYYYFYYLVQSFASVRLGEFELLPEDKDEPERLELLDAAIPITFTTRLVLFGQGGLTAARPWRCLHFPHAPVCFTFDA